MTVAKGKKSFSYNDVEGKVSEYSVLASYLGISKIPCLINSPFRNDSKPSFGLFSPDGRHIFYKDFATKESGNTYQLLARLWGYSVEDVIERLLKTEVSYKEDGSIRKVRKRKQVSSTDNTVEMQVKVREWEDYDLEFWGSFGITKDWLEYAEVYPISHKIITKNCNTYTFLADKYAYCYVERKDGKITYKIYQPFNTKGFKWSSNINTSVWSLWTKIPEYGDYLIITSSLKDSLNLWINTKIPSICMQGEGYLPKDHIIEELKNRFKCIIVFYDNDYSNKDNPGRKDSIYLCEKYNLKRVEIPEKYEAKDPSDLYKKYGRKKYMEIMKEIFKDIVSLPLQVKLNN